MSKKLVTPCCVYDYESKTTYARMDLFDKQYPFSYDEYKCYSCSSTGMCKELVEVYEFSVVCDNCDFFGLVHIPWGNPIKGHPCKECGCRTLRNPQ